MHRQHRLRMISAKEQQFSLCINTGGIDDGFLAHTRLGSTQIPTLYLVGVKSAMLPPSVKSAGLIEIRVV